VIVRALAAMMFLAPALALAACADVLSQSSGPVAATITFKHQAPLSVDVARIELVETWQQSGTPPHIGHLNRNNPPKIIRAWVRDRLKAVPGGPGAAQGSILRVVLRDGAVVRNALDVREGVEGIFRDEVDTSIEAVCAVDVELLDQKGTRMAGITVRVTGTRNIFESASLNERDTLYFGLMEELATALNTELENGMRAELGFLLTR